MGIGKVLPVFIAGVGLGLGAPYTKDFAVNSYEWITAPSPPRPDKPLSAFRKDLPTIHAFDKDGDGILNKEEAREFIFHYLEIDKNINRLTDRECGYLENLRRWFRKNSDGAPNILAIISNLEEVQDDIVREQFKAEQSAKK